MFGEKGLLMKLSACKYVSNMYLMCNSPKLEIKSEHFAVLVTLLKLLMTCSNENNRIPQANFIIRSYLTEAYA